MDVADERARPSARAGAGTNNIPVAKLSQARRAGVQRAGRERQRGQGAGASPACSSPRATSARRGITSRKLKGDDEQLDEAVEEGKKQFAGFELPGRTLGVIGLGAIGVLVADAAILLGMHVLGFDPQITVERRGSCRRSRAGAVARRGVLALRHDQLHVPLLEATRNLINAQRLRLMRNGSVVLNFARSGIVDEAAVLEALGSGKLNALRLRFPDGAAEGPSEVVALPHLGASTGEAEENCAVMVVDQLRDFLENGNIRNAVNFPEAMLPRTAAHRLAIANANVPNMVGQISTRWRPRTQHPRPAQQVARRDGVHAGRRRRRGARGGARQARGRSKACSRCASSSLHDAQEEDLQIGLQPDRRRVGPKPDARSSIRDRIDDIDRRIHELLNERARFAQQVGDSKARRA